MRRATGGRWLAIVAASAALSGCSPGGAPAERDPLESPLTGAAIREAAGDYEDWGCSACHGAAGEGTDLAPALVDLGRNWTAEALADYLLDPAGYGARSPRVRDLQQQYDDLQMPAFDYPEQRRRSLGEWLLAGLPNTR